MSDANRTKVSLVEEVTYGVTPANPVFQNLRVTGSQMKFMPTTKESKELRSDRMLQDLIRVSQASGGTLPLEVSYGSLDIPLRFALMSDWVRTPVRDNNGTAASELTSVVVTTGVYNFLTTGATNTDAHFGAFAIGHLVRASGFANAANNGLFRASAATATSVTLGNTSVVDAAPVAAARLKVVGFRGAAADITATATGLGSTALDFTTLGLAVGMWIKVGGSVAGEQFATAALNGWARITGVAATALTLDNLPAGWGVDAGTGKTITVYFGDYIRNGVTERNFSLEQQYLDLVVPEYDYFTGQGVDKLDVTMKSRDIIGASLTLKGSSATNTTTRVAGATDVAAKTNDVLNTGSNLGQIAENGVALSGTTAVTSLDLSFQNGIRDRPALGSMGNADLAIGTFRLTGKMSMYYASNAIRTRVLAGTSTSFNTRIIDTTAPVNSRGYVIDIPKLKFNNGDVNVPGIDTDRTLDPEFTALASANGYAVHIQRFEEVYQ